MEKTSYGISDIGAETDPRVQTYPECGAGKTKSKRKNPVIAALLSCIIPGLGQVYAGDPLRGFAILAALAVSLCLMALIIGVITFIGAWLFGIVDAYKMVKKQNNKNELCNVVF